MERILTSPIWTSNVCFNSCWTYCFVCISLNISVRLSLSLHCLLVCLKKFAPKSGFYVLTPWVIFLVYRAKSQEIPWRKHTSVQVIESDLKVSTAATLLQTTTIIFTACTETARRWIVLWAAVSSGWKQEKIWRKLCQHFQRVICVLWLPHRLFKVARTAASINCLVISESITLMDFCFTGLKFAIKFCWRILKFLCFKFCVRDINKNLFPMVASYAASATSLLYI